MSYSAQYDFLNAETKPPNLTASIPYYKDSDSPYRGVDLSRYLSDPLGRPKDLVIYGDIGKGKTTLLYEIYSRLESSASITSSLADTMSGSGVQVKPKPDPILIDRGSEEKIMSRFPYEDLERVLEQFNLISPVGLSLASVEIPQLSTGQRWLLCMIGHLMDTEGCSILIDNFGWCLGEGSSIEMLKFLKRLKGCRIIVTTTRPGVRDFFFETLRLCLS